ncbi:hypothetical protein [Paenibacillus tyrfis]|uniref:hypothetical protein n=1 Tax=Paenibacillus tyrfis TaxID=1501230 RepID=UPI00209F6407|nr:hypothetical protein [Paenibacillus tyrfis]MCP1306542.1 hypothetical protein [Paenibacillus tyrfis]
MICTCGNRIKKVFFFETDEESGKGTNYAVSFVCTECQDSKTYDVKIYKRLAEYLNIDYELVCSCLRISKGTHKLYLESKHLLQLLNIPVEAGENILSKHMAAEK